MTTGRINQVTTVLRSWRAQGAQVRRAARKAPVVISSNGWGDLDHPPATDPAGRDRGEATGIQLPPLSFPRRGPQQTSGAVDPDL